MTDMTNEEAVLKIVDAYHYLPLSPDGDEHRRAFALAIAALQRPVVTREQIARLIDPVAFEVDLPFRKDFATTRIKWITLFQGDMWAIQSAYDRADVILQLFQAQGSDFGGCDTLPAQGGLGSSAGTKVTREALESYLMDMPHDLNSSSGLASAADEIIALLEGRG